MSSIFEDAIDATFNGWTKADGTSLKDDPEAKKAIIDELRKNGFCGLRAIA